eukprot:651375_1
MSSATKKSSSASKKPSSTKTPSPYQNWPHNVDSSLINLFAQSTFQYKDRKKTLQIGQIHKRLKAKHPEFDIKDSRVAQSRLGRVLSLYLKGIQSSSTKTDGAYVLSLNVTWSIPAELYEDYITNEGAPTESNHNTKTTLNSTHSTLIADHPSFDVQFIKSLSHRNTPIILQHSPSDDEEDITSDPENMTGGSQIQIRELLKHLPRIVEGIQSMNKAVILECVRNIRVLLSLSQTASPIKQVMETCTGAIPRIISLLQMNECSEIQFEALWILSNIASTNHTFTGFLVRQGVLPYVGAILKLPNYPLQEQAVWTLGNIAGDGDHLRNQVLQDMLPSILDICTSRFDDNSYCDSIGDNADSAVNQYRSLLDTLSWCLSNLRCGGGHTEVQSQMLTKCKSFVDDSKMQMRMQDDSEESPPPPLILQKQNMMDASPFLKPAETPDITMMDRTLSVTVAEDDDDDDDSAMQPLNGFDAVMQTLNGLPVSEAPIAAAYEDCYRYWQCPTCYWMNTWRTQCANCFNGQC